MSCTKILIGTKSFKQRKPERVVKLAHKWDIDTSKLYFINGERYYNYLRNDKSYSDRQKKYMYQPLQFRLYRNDTLVNLLPNCLVGGFPNIKWNLFNRLEQLPPKGTYQFSGDTVVLFSQESEFVGYLKNGKSYEIKSQEKEIVVIYWMVYMGKQSRITIKALNLYLQKFPNDQRILIYLNTDDVYLYEDSINKNLNP